MYNVRVCILSTALYVSVDRRITLKSLKAALEPHIGTTVDNFQVVHHYVLCFVCLSVLLNVCLCVSPSVSVFLSLITSISQMSCS